MSSLSVSVLTPSLNQGRFIGDCLSSVLMQTYAPIEHLVQDGGSSDNTVELLRQNARPGLDWKAEPDRGTGDALLKAYARSSGEIIGWLNSDDAYAVPDAVETAAGIFARMPEVDVVYGHALLVNSDDVVLRILKGIRFSQRLLRIGCYIFQPTVFVRRRVFDRQPFVTDRVEHVLDYELWLRLAAAGARFYKADAFLAIDRHHPGRKVEMLKDIVDREVSLLRGPASPVMRLRWDWSRLRARVEGGALVARLYRTKLLPFLRLPPRAQFYAQQLVVQRRLLS